MVEVASMNAPTMKEEVAMRNVVRWVTSGQAAKEGDSMRTMRVVAHDVMVVCTDPAVRKAVGAWDWNVDWRS